MKLMPVLRSLIPAATAALCCLPGAAGADWVVNERQTEDGATIVAETFARTGDARLVVGCTAERLQYTSLEYLGYDSAADSLTVRYRVDGRNPIDALWPREPTFNALLLYNSNQTFVREFARRVAEGNWLVIDVEVLPTLRFNLRGSRDAVEAVAAWCDDAPPGAEMTGEGGGPDGAEFDTPTAGAPDDPDAGSSLTPADPTISPSHE